MILYNFIDTIGSIDAPNTIYVVVEGTKNRLNKVEESFRGGVEVYHSLMWIDLWWDSKVNLVKWITGNKNRKKEKRSRDTPKRKKMKKRKEWERN